MPEVMKKNPIPPIPSYMVLLLGLAIFYVFQQALVSPKTQSISYSQFKQDLNAGKIASVVISRESIQGNYKSDQQLPAGQVLKFKTIIPPVEDEGLFAALESQEVKIEAKAQSPSLLVSLLINFLPWLLIVGFFVWSSRRLNSAMGNLRPGGSLYKSKAKRFDPSKVSVTFADVAGVENAKTDLQEVVDFLKHPEKYVEIGAKLPKGILLMGAPGTGKTLLAKATAGEAGVPFFSISASEFIELYVGMGAARVRDLFETAKKEAPSIIFIDEIDSIGRARGTGLGGGHDEREQTLNQILSELDGFSTDEPVMVIAATNRPDVLDSALIRPGRFDRQIVLELPLAEAREKILLIHTKDVPLAETLDLKKLAQSTVGFSGADLRNLVNEAALFCARKSKKKVDWKDFDEARDKIVMGNPREEMISEKDKEVVSIHEAGHALVALLTPNADPIRKITILPRGRALGYTEQVPEEDRVNMSKSYIEGQIAILLGGRIAERIIFNEVTTGAENDLKRATKLVRKMVVNWGMSDQLDCLAYQQGEEHHFLGKELVQPKDFSEKTAAIIDEEVARIMKGRKSYVINLIEDNKDKLLLISGELMRKETITSDEIKELLEPPRVASVTSIVPREQN